MAEHNGESDLLQELDRMNASIEAYENQIEVLNDALGAIEAENNNDSVAKQILEYQVACERDPANIPAEDALDTITRLQNTLKIVRRRNQLLARENATQEKLKRDRATQLEKMTKVYEQLVHATGWHDHLRFNPEANEQMTSDLQQMQQIEATVRKELRVAQSIVKKKENMILELEEQLKAGEELELQINNTYNDIRVKQRDCRDITHRLERMRKEDESNDQALTVFESKRASASLMYVENDMEYLKEAVAKMKYTCRRQEEVIRAQMTRQQQLHARLDLVMQSLRDLKMEKAYERNVSKSALVPSASREEPDDISKVLPQEEYIPVHTYRLIHKNNEMLHTSVARKNMLALEKEGVIAALEANLVKYTAALNMSSKQQEDLKHNKDLELGELMEELQQQHQNYLRQLEKVLQDNTELKKKVRRPAPSCTLIKNL